MSGYVIFAIIKTTKSPTFKNILKQGIQSIQDIFVHGVTEHSKLKHPYVYIPTNANHPNISLCNFCNDYTKCVLMSNERK